MINDANRRVLGRLRDYVIPLTTPFTDELDVDHEGLRHNIRRILALPGCGGVYFGSVYQEFWSLSLDERKAIIETVISEVRGRVPVVAGVSSTSVADTTSLAKHAEEAGADMLMIWPPIFGPRDDEGVLRFYQTVLGGIHTPVCVYSSILSELGFFLTLDMLKRLAEFDAVCAVKEASFSLSTYLSVLSELGDKLAISTPFEEYWIAGRALLPGKTPEFLMGSSRALYMQTPERPQLARCLELARKEAFAEAYAQLGHVTAIVQGIQMKAFTTGKHPIALVKYALDLLGMRGGPVRPPTAQLTEPEREMFEQALRSAGLISAA